MTAARAVHVRYRRNDGIVDHIAVERAMHGERLLLTRQERAEAVRLLTVHGVSAREISKRLRMSSRTVVRDRGDR